MKQEQVASYFALCALITFSRAESLLPKGFVLFVGNLTSDAVYQLQKQ